MTNSELLRVMFLDVDHFKAVNDSLGHILVDDLLKAAAARIVGAIRAGDTVGRFGGDEFVVVCDDVSVIEIAERVLEAVSQPYALGDQETIVTASVGIVADVLDRTGARPEGLCLELTETLFMENLDECATKLAVPKGLGVRLAIDDFGTRFSSLSYLQRFPTDAVKIDRAFVDRLGTDPHASTLVTAIIAMAEALGLQIIDEGVETRTGSAISEGSNASEPKVST